MTLQVQKLKLSIGNKIICRELDICFQPGEFWGIMGMNGVGKTTLLKTLLGLYPADSGAILLDNKLIVDYQRKILAQHVGMMFQEYEYNFPCTVLEAALIGRHPFLKQWQLEDQNDFLIAQEALNLVGLEAFSERSINTLSGGEKRRLNLATLLSQDPDYFLLDEPINHLDLKAQNEILTLLANRINHSRHCGIMVIHDVNLAYRFCDNILMMFEDGQCLSGKTGEIITPDNLSRLYGCNIQHLKDSEYTFFMPEQTFNTDEDV